MADRQMRGQFRVTVLHNPSAGARSVDGRGLREAFRLPGVRLRYASLKEPDWRDAIDGDSDLVIAAGGDGAVRKVAADIFRKELATRVPMGILPIGTANNVAASLGVVSTIEDAVLTTRDSLALGFRSAVERQLDMLLVRHDEDSALAIESAGFGVLARVLRYLDSESNAEHLREHARDETHHDYTDMLVGALAWQEIVRSTPAFDCRLTVDGSAREERCIFAAAFNTRSIGPRLTLAGDGSPGDGLLDVVMVTERQCRAFERHLDASIDRLREGELPPEPATPVATVTRGISVSIEAPGESSHIDDSLLLPEHGTPSRLDVEVIRNALRVWIPAARSALV